MCIAYFRKYLIHFCYYIRFVFGFVSRISVCTPCSLFTSLCSVHMLTAVTHNTPNNNCLPTRSNKHVPVFLQTRYKQGICNIRCRCLGWQSYSEEGRAAISMVWLLGQQQQEVAVTTCYLTWPDKLSQYVYTVCTHNVLFINIARVTTAAVFQARRLSDMHC